MIVKEYRARPGSHLSDRDAVRIGEFLEVKFGNDPRTAEQIVKAARPKRSVIHGDFEWDNAVAAEEYRLEQARRIMRSIHIVLVNGEERGPTRAFHSVVVERPSGMASAYVPAMVVWENDDLSSQVVEQALRELISWKTRYSQYKELASVVSHVESAVELMSMA